MNPADLQRYKNLLQEKQQELSFEEPHPESPAPNAGVLAGDLLDQANADAEADLQVRLRQNESHLLRAIDDALARMRKGTYGICETCQQPISKVRLEAVPGHASAAPARKLNPPLEFVRRVISGESKVGAEPSQDFVWLRLRLGLKETTAL
jgi:DnaK suppressor protein